MTTRRTPRACYAAQHTTHGNHTIHVWCAKENGHNGEHHNVAGVTFTDHAHDKETR